MLKALTFSDVSVIPCFSNLDSKEDVSLKSFVGPKSLNIPIISAPMDTVTDTDMAVFMDSYGGLGVIHRFMPLEEQVQHTLLAIKDSKNGNIAAAIGVNGDSWQRTEALVDAGVTTLVLDVAHGHTAAVLSQIERIKKRFPDIILVSANICTAPAAHDCINAGADALRVGIGPGSACSTRVVAGVGVPQITAVLEVASVVDAESHDVTIICDGGIRTSGDIVKALVAGADTVMLGGMLAPFVVSAAPVIMVNTGEKSQLDKVLRTWVETEGAQANDVFENGFEKIDFGNAWTKKKLFRGMASDSALSEYKKSDRYVVEGEEFLIDIDYDSDKTFQGIIDGVRLGLSYLGCESVKEASIYGSFVEITSSGWKESLPHKES